MSNSRSRCGLRRNTEEKENEGTEGCWSFGMIVGTILLCPPYSVLSVSNKCEEETQRRRGLRGG